LPGWRALAGPVKYSLNHLAPLSLMCWNSNQAQTSAQGVKIIMLIA